MKKAILLLAIAGISMGTHADKQSDYYDKCMLVCPDVPKDKKFKVAGSKQKITSKGKKNCKKVCKAAAKNVK